MATKSFPKIKNLDNFLYSLTLTKPEIEGNYSCQLLSEPKPVVASIDSRGKEQVGFSAEVKIWYKEVGGFGLEQLIGIISERAIKNGHFIDRMSCLSIIGFYILLRPPPSSLAADFLFETIDNTVNTTVDFFFILEKSMPTQSYPPFSFGSYTVGKVDVRKIRKLCIAAKSDYHEHYESTLSGRDSIYRKFTNINLINWYPLQKKKLIEFRLIPSKMHLFEELREQYFSNQHRLLLEKFFDEMFDQQEILFSLGNAYFDDRPLQHMKNINCLAVFENVNGDGTLGYVSSYRLLHRKHNLNEISERINMTSELLKSQYNLMETSAIPINSTIKTYGAFLAKAKRFFLDRHPDEAFLHFAIALDLVFGEINKSTDSISLRVAALTHYFTDISFQEQVKLIKNLYDARSKYVHEGKKVKNEQLEHIDEICSIVLRCMLTLQKDEKNRSELNIKNWLRNLDLIAATLNTGKSPSDDLYIECGVLFNKNESDM